MKINPKVVAAVAVLLVVALLLIVLFAAGPWVDNVARRKISEVGKDRFDSTVTVQRVSVSLVPPSATLSGILFRHKGRTDVPPLFEIEQLHVRGGLGLFAPTPKASTVRLTGLRIVIPRSQAPSESKSRGGGGGANFGASEIIADGANLKVLSKKPGRDPLEFDLQHLRLHDVSLDQPMRYNARLTNPKPPGLIESDGAFGPWNGPDPARTPLQGKYDFAKADLSHFKGIAGILNSQGNFKGILEQITVDGHADVSNFALDISRNPIALKTKFHAIVDGTNGDTRLEPVNAQFLNSKIVAKGGIEGREGQKGKTVRLDVNVEQARIEDMLRLALKGEEPLLTGPIRFQTQLELPPGSEDVIQRLRLDGRFQIDNGQFQKNQLQDKIDSLSRKGQGEPESTAVQDVASDLAGNFSLAAGALRLQNLSFRVPGALVRTGGTYGLRSESLDFQGTLRLDAKVSETTTGFKSLLLKAVDPLFSRKTKAGSVIPFKIAGTRSKPAVGLDIGKVVNPD